MRLSTDSFNVVMSIDEHNHFFKLCQDARVIIINGNGPMPYTINMHQVTYTYGMCEILVDVKYVRSNFNLLLLHHYASGQEDVFMDKLRQITQQLDS